MGWGTTDYGSGGWGSNPSGRANEIPCATRGFLYALYRRWNERGQPLGVIRSVGLRRRVITLAPDTHSMCLICAVGIKREGAV
jgi:hypothetical protein